MPDGPPSVTILPWCSPLSSAASSTGLPSVPPSPVPRRVRTPGWLDLRLVLGVVLVVGSVLVGAAVVARAHTTRPLVTAARDLAAGTVLSADDLAVVRVQMGDARPVAMRPTRRRCSGAACSARSEPASSCRPRPPAPRRPSPPSP